MNEQEEHSEPPDLETATKALQKRDRVFLFRLALRLGVALLLGVWIALQISQSDIGGCAAQGFETVSERESSLNSGGTDVQAFQIAHSSISGVESRHGIAQP